MPWYFWLIIGVAVLLRVLVETAQRGRGRRKPVRSSIANADSPAGTQSNERLMPCQDCRRMISINALSCPHCGAPVSASYVESVKAKRDFARRKLRKEADESSVLTGHGCVLVLFACALFLVLKFTSGVLMWILAAILLLFIVTGICDTLRLRDKGKLGEEIVKQKLANRLPKDKYKIINDVFLPLKEGGTTQIDHIIVSIYGVFVVETKNYSGWIFADRNQQSWTQSIGREKFHFQNPIRQNYLHICSIADDLGLPKEFLHGIVTFADDCEFKTEMPDGVVFFNDLAAYILRFSEQILKQCEVDDIFSAIKEWNASVSPMQRADHVKGISERLARKEA